MTAFLNRFVNKAADHLIEKITDVIFAVEKHPDYPWAKQILEQAAQDLQTYQKCSIAGLYIGVTAATLGLGCCMATRFTVGIPLICLGIPASFLSYNCYKASANLRTNVEENPAQLLVIIPEKNNMLFLPPLKLKKCLLNGTFCFEPFIHWYVNKIPKENFIFSDSSEKE
jgi:hypothetical protein